MREGEAGKPRNERRTCKSERERERESEREREMGTEKAEEERGV